MELIMHFVLKEDKRYAPSITVLTVLCLAFGFCSVLLYHIGIVLLPLCAAFYAAILTLENREKRISSYIIPPILVITEIIFLGFYSFNSLFALLVGYALFYAARAPHAKFDAAFVITLFTSLYIALLLFLQAAAVTGNVSIDAAREYYASLAELFRVEFVEALTSVTVPPEAESLKELFTEEGANAVFGEMLNALLPMLIIFAFFLVGVSFKIYSALVYRYARDGENIFRWRFTVAPLFAYAYIAVFFIGFFTADAGSVLSRSASVLESVLMMVFVYVGVSFLHAIIAHKAGGVGATLIVAVAFVILSSIAIQILSFLGVLITLMSDKIIRNTRGNNLTNKGDNRNE